MLEYMIDVAGYQVLDVNGQLGFPRCGCSCGFRGLGQLGGLSQRQDGYEI